MKMLKRIPLILCMAPLILSLCACGTSKGSLNGIMTEGKDFRNSNIGDSISSVKSAETLKDPSEMSAKDYPNVMKAGQTIVRYKNQKINGMDASIIYEFYDNSLKYSTISLSTPSAGSLYKEAISYYENILGQKATPDNSGAYFLTSGKYIVLSKTKDSLTIIVSEEAFYNTEVLGK